MQQERTKKHKAHAADDCGSPSARKLASFYFGSSAEEQSCAILQELESSSGASALASCFRNFLKEAGINPARGSRETAQEQLTSLKRKQQAVKLPDTELLLNVTLEDLYNGAVKWVPVERKKHDGLGHVVAVQERLQVRVQPGITEGTRITLPGLGNEDVIGNMSDLTFIVQQQLHPAFRRLKDDLYAIVNVPLVTALTGGPVCLKTLSGQLLQLPVGDGVITPGSELVLPNQGMPVFGDNTGKRGALHVRFNVSFPTRISQQQRVQLRHTLAGCEFLSSSQRPHLLPVLPHPGASQHRHWIHAGAADGEQPQQERQENCTATQRQGAAVSAGSDSSGNSSDYAMAAVATAAATAAAATAAAVGHAAAVAGGGRVYYAPGSSAATSAGSTSVAGFACTHSTGTSGSSKVS